MLETEMNTVENAVESKVGTLNWCYGAYAPMTAGDVVENQMRLVHRYKNKWVRFERNRREEADRTIRVLSPEYDRKMQASDAANAELERLRTELKLRRQKAQRRLEPTAEEAEAFDAAIELCKKTWEDAKVERAAAYKILHDRQAVVRAEALKQVCKELGVPVPELPKEEASSEEAPPEPKVKGKKGPKPKKKKKPGLPRKISIPYKQRYLELASDTPVGQGRFLDAGEWVCAEAQRQARKGSDLYSGNYVIAERAFDNVRSGPPPTFKRYDGTGFVGAQLQGGMTIEEATSGTSQTLYLELLKITERMATKGKDRGREAIGYCHLRVLSGEKRKPIWAKIPFVYSREFPKDAKIQFVILHRTRVGSVFHWKLRFELRTTHQSQPRVTNGRKVAVHMGYRLFPQGIRVAVTLDDEGNRRDLFVDNALLSRFLYTDDLKSIQSTNFDMARDAFWAWRKTLRNAPDWFMERSENAYAWKDTWKLAQLVLHWEENRFEGDTAITPHLGLLFDWAVNRPQCSSRAMQDTKTAFGLFRYWTSWNRHMVDWIANQHRKPTITRDQMYRGFIRELRSNYETIVLADIDWKKLAEQEKPEEGIVQTNVQRRLARIAAPGRLFEYAKERFAVDTIRVSGQSITETCHVCGKKEDWDRKKLMHQCRHCGATWDQDINAVNNEMKRAISK